MIRIESLTAFELDRKLGQSEFFTGPVIPITRHRAESQLRNPDLEEGDIVLNIARDVDGRVIGFIGALPARLNEKVRFAWNSGWWVDPVRGRHVAMPLFYKFLEQWDMKIMFSELTPYTHEILEKMSFMNTFMKEGIRLYYRSAFARMLPNRSKNFRKIKWLLALLDFLVNIPVFLYRISWLLVHMKKDDRFSEVSEIDGETETLIEESREKAAIPRRKEHFEWIRNHPWILRHKPDQWEGQYPFSAYDKEFRQMWIRMDERGAPKAFIIVNLHRRHMTIPYIFMTSNELLPAIAGHLNWLAAKSGAMMLSSWHPELSVTIKSRYGPSIYQKSVKRFACFSNRMFNFFGTKITIYDGDGDVSFT